MDEKATRKNIPTLIAERKPFTNESGTLRGIVNPTDIPKGMLQENERGYLRIDMDTQGIAYVVMSYDTPIAWVTKTGWTHKVVQDFTQTTRQHQELLHLLS